MTPGALPAVVVPSGSKIGFERGQRLDRRVAPDRLVELDVADGDDLLREVPGVLRSSSTSLRARRPRVLRLARDLELAGDTRGLHDHVISVEGRGQPVEDHVVENLAVAEPVAEPRIRQEVRRLRHRLHPARDDDIVLAGADHQIGERDRPDRRRADLVDRVGRNLDRDPGTDRGLARRRLPDSGLEHLSHDDVADLDRIDAGALEARPDRDRAELRRRMLREGATEPAERRPDSGDDDGATHCAQGTASDARRTCRASEGTTTRPPTTERTPRSVAMWRRRPRAARSRRRCACSAAECRRSGLRLPDLHRRCRRHRCSVECPDSIVSGIPAAARDGEQSVSDDRADHRAAEDRWATTEPHVSPWRRPRCVARVR